MDFGVVVMESPPILGQEIKQLIQIHQLAQVSLDNQQNGIE